MNAIHRFYLDDFIEKHLRHFENNIAEMECSLADGHNAELEACAVAIDRIRDARIALKVAQGEAEQDRQRELARLRCMEIGEGR